jgi:hypothetical protein
VTFDLLDRLECLLPIGLRQRYRHDFARSPGSVSGAPYILADLLSRGSALADFQNGSSRRLSGWQNGVQCLRYSQRRLEPIPWRPHAQRLDPKPGDVASKAPPKQLRPETCPIRLTVFLAGRRPRRTTTWRSKRRYTEGEGGTNKWHTTTMEAAWRGFWPEPRSARR